MRKKEETPELLLSLPHEDTVRRQPSESQDLTTVS